MAKEDFAALTKRKGSSERREDLREPAQRCRGFLRQKIQALRGTAAAIPAHGWGESASLGPGSLRRCARLTRWASQSHLLAD